MNVFGKWKRQLGSSSDSTSQKQISPILCPFLFEHGSSTHLRDILSDLEEEGKDLVG